MIAVVALTAVDAAPLAAQDTLVVRADNPPAWGQDLRLVEEVRIGQLDGAPQYTFGRIPPNGVIVQPDGVIWVADYHARTIRRFGSAGGHIDDVGRAGEGPGEFERIDAIARLPDGRVAVRDGQLRRVSLFGPDGRYLDQFPARFRLVIPSWFLADTAGNVWLYDSDGRADRRYWWRRYTPDGQPLDSVRVPAEDREGARFAGQRYGRTSMRAFPHETLSHPSPHGYLVVGRNEDYVLHRPLPDGRVVRIERPWDPVPVKAEERAAFQTLEDHFAARRRWSAERVPSEKPPFWHLWVDQDGRIWVARHGEGEHIPETSDERARRLRFDNPPNEWWEPLVFDVIEPNGRFLGTVRFPNRQTTVMVARGERVWVVERGEFDEQYVVRYRIEG